MPIVKCEVCGKEVSRGQARLKKHKHVYCSKACMGKDQSKQVEAVCDYCGKKFFRMAYRVKKNTNNFCSNECRYAYMRGQERPDTWKVGYVKCDYCGKGVHKSPSELAHSKHHFCSPECTRLWRREYYSGENNPNYSDATEIIQCSNCGKNVEVSQYRLTRSKYLFCSIECRAKFLSRENAPNWRGGTWDTPYPSEWNGKLRKMIRDRDNRQCQLCFRHESSLGRKLHVHHIDLDKTNCVESNLISLCQACHTRVHNQLKSNPERANKIIWSWLKNEKVKTIAAD